MPSKVVRLRLPSTYIPSNPSKEGATYTPSRPPARSQQKDEYLSEEWQEKEKYHSWLGKRYLSRIETRQHNLSLEQMMNRPAQVMTKGAKEETCFRSTLPIICEDLIITTSDGCPLLVFLKGGLLEPWRPEQKIEIRSRLNKAVQDLLSVYKPPKPSPDAQGHKDVVLTDHTRKAGYKSNAAITLYRTLAPVAQTIGILFEGIDKPAYDRYCGNYERLARNTDLYGLHFSKRDCWATLGLLVNWMVGPHFDRQDPKDGYVADLVSGSFTGGELVIPELSVQIALQPGDILLMRSRLLEHFLAPFSGERYAFIYFQHQDLFEDVKSRPRRTGALDAKDKEKVQSGKEIGGPETRARKQDKEKVQSGKEIGGPETRARKRRRQLAGEDIECRY
ncbi:MAG: hypothetical protein M1816_002656 [Peltula sp. TS41687]|nr:MAG: hypothetical protein M1816_002656 [Peltula sp. TS41687]